MTASYVLSPSAFLYHADCREALRALPDNSIDSVVTDPPYALVSTIKRFANSPRMEESMPTAGPFERSSRGFMGCRWDTGETAFSVEFWAQVLRVLKPGGHVAAFGATRGYHRMACAIEDAGFEIRDSLINMIDPAHPIIDFMSSLSEEQLGAFLRCIDDSQFGGLLAWTYGVGFPKGQNVSKFIDNELGAVRDKVRHLPRPESSGTFAGAMDTRPWIEEARRVGYHEVDSDVSITPEAQKYEGFSTALKPAFEPIVLARKPLSEKTVAANVLRWGTGALNIDGCRVGNESMRVTRSDGTFKSDNGSMAGHNTGRIEAGEKEGRWPANICHDGSAEVLEAFPDNRGGGFGKRGGNKSLTSYGFEQGTMETVGYGDSGSAARFFYNTTESDSEWLAQSLPIGHASAAAECLPLQSELVAFVLSSVAARSMLPWGLTCSDSLAPSMGVTPKELRRISEIVIEMIQNLDGRCSPEPLPVKHSRSDCLAKIVAIQKQTDTITITVSLSKSSGYAAPVTFNTMRLNSELGAKDCANRFHYSAKATKADRNGSKHPTVKPIKLMQWLARLITPPGGAVLDPFAGSGTTGAACALEGFNCVMVEREAEYVADIIARFVGSVPLVPDTQQFTESSRTSAHLDRG